MPVKQCVQDVQTRNRYLQELCRRYPAQRSWLFKHPHSPERAWAAVACAGSVNLNLSKDVAGEHWRQEECSRTKLGQDYRSCLLHSDLKHLAGDTVNHYACCCARITLAWLCLMVLDAIVPLQKVSSLYQIQRNPNPWYTKCDES